MPLGQLAHPHYCEHSASIRAGIPLHCIALAHIHKSFGDFPRDYCFILEDLALVLKDCADSSPGLFGSKAECSFVLPLQLGEGWWQCDPILSLTGFAQQAAQRLFEWNACQGAISGDSWDIINLHDTITASVP